MQTPANSAAGKYCRHITKSSARINAKTFGGIYTGVKRVIFIPASRTAQAAERKSMYTETATKNIVHMNATLKIDFTQTRPQRHHNIFR